MNHLPFRLALLALIIAAPAAMAAAALDGAQYLKQARVDLATARATALKAAPGTIVAQELEREKGGSGLRYSFDVRQGKDTREVGVDAMTGALLENAVEGPNPD